MIEDGGRHYKSNPCLCTTHREIEGVVPDKAVDRKQRKGEGVGLSTTVREPEIEGKRKGGREKESEREHQTQKERDGERRRETKTDGGTDRGMDRQTYVYTYGRTDEWTDSLLRETSGAGRFW